MAFGAPKETKEEKQARKEQELLAKFGLDKMENKDYVDSVRKIAAELSGTDMMEMGMRLSGAKTADSLMVSYLRCIVEQNFIMIRQLDKLCSVMEK